jgi:hypothetical protein
MDNLKGNIHETFDKLFDNVYKMDELKRKLVANLQGYLRERMDFIASLPTMDPLWTAQFDIIDNLINPILDDIRDEKLNPLYKCPNLFLLFDGILRSEGIRAGGIAFEIKIFKSVSREPDYTYTWTSGFKLNDNQIKYEINEKGKETEFPISVSLGISGVQAFYGILENIIRNSGRHSNKDEIKKVVEYSNAIKEKKLPTDNSHPLRIIIEFYYDWKDDYKEYKDDFIKVRIYDNMEGWEKEKDNKWVKYDKSITIEQIKTLLSPELKEYEKGNGNKIVRDGRIIDDTGSTVQGNWGFKEMRICASFLRGIKISDYEIQHTPPVITAIAVPEKNKASLGFEFYIPKVKNLLIVSKNLGSEINKEDLKNKGIYIEENVSKIIDLQNRGVFTHEFVAIDIDDEGNRKFIQENSLLLPYKLFFISGQNKNLDGIINLFKEIRYDLYIKNSISDNDKENLKNLIISKNELLQWLTQNGTFEINSVQYQCSPAERVYLEIYKRWENYLENGNPLPKVAIYPSKYLLNNSKIQNPNIKQTGNYVTNIVSLYQTINHNVNLKNSSLLLHRWGIEEGVYHGIIKKNPLAIIPFAGGISSKATKIAEYYQKEAFSHLTNQGHLYDFNFYGYFLSLAEAGSLNVVIIDERIFEETKNRKNICGVSINFALNWYLQNVIILNLDKEKEYFVLKGYKVEPENFDEPLKEKEIKFNSKSNLETNSFMELFPERFKTKIHFMIIHQNIISPKISGKTEFEKFISFLPDEFKPWYVVITSGRGHPSENDMPRNTKFLDFSTLRSIIIDQPDKILLAKILTHLKEEFKMR